MLILPVAKDRLSWETIEFSGLSIQVSLYNQADDLLSIK